MRSIRQKVSKLSLLALLCCFLFLANGLVWESWAQTSVNGSLRQVGNQQVLDLWGSHYEMGYAHGYLLADKIRDLIDTYVIGVLLNGDVSSYIYRISLIPTFHTFYPDYVDEINGMVAGMVASGKSLYVPSLGRNIGASDIEAFNLFVELYFGCSSFGVWGTSTANGAAIVARNYDFFYDTQGNILKNQMLITYEATGKPKVVSFGWPGWFGVTSGINETGVSVTLNAGNGANSSGNGPFHPVTEVLRYILENTASASYLTQPLSMVNSVYEYVPIIVQIGSAYNGSTDPVYYIEDSPPVGPSIIRWAPDTDPGENFIIATNHFLKVMPPITSGDSVDRYNYLHNGLVNLLGTGDHEVDSTEAWSLLNGVADIVAPTLMSMVFRPNTMDFDVSFATTVNGVVTTATHVQPQTYAWASLFSSQGITITATAGTGGTMLPLGTVSVASGGNQTFTITPNAGYTVSALTVDGAPVTAGTSYTFTNVTATHSIAATFASTYVITSTAGTGGTISPLGTVSVPGGGSQTFTITPNTGYGVSKVTVDGASVGAVSSYAFNSVTANHTIAATFTTKKYTITATAGTGGTISPSGTVSVPGGGSQTFTITPKTGYGVSTVTVDGASVGAVSSYAFNSVTANHTITATFTTKKYTITATAGTGGTISPSGSVSVASGANQTFTITPNSGYAIGSVTVDGASAGTVSTYTFTGVAANHTIAATFAVANATLTSISVAPSSASVTVNGTQQFSATAYDQSGNVMAPQPTFSWTVSGGGTITNGGLFTAAGTAGGPYTVTASSGSVSGTASVTVTSASAIKIGETTILSGDDNGNGNLLLAQQTSLGQTATITSMSFYVTTTGGSLRLGIYDATGPGGGPGTLKAQTASFTPVSGWNTANVTSPVSLTAGTYWIAYLPSSNALGFKVATTGSARFYSYTSGTMPTTFSTSPNSATAHWSFYATLQP